MILLPAHPASFVHIFVSGLDFKKAFDSVPLGRLLTKLKGYGFDGTLLKWIEDFFIRAQTTGNLNP